MDIRQRKEMKLFARQRLSHAKEAKKILLIFASASLGLALLATVINYLLALEIDKTGGLSNMGTRAVLDTIQQMLPLVQVMVTACLELGFTGAMLRVARGQYVSHRTLKLGFDRFWPLLRLTAIRALIFLGAGMFCLYCGTLIYVMTPFSNAAMDILKPVMANMTVMDPTVLLNDSLVYELLDAMIPCFVICGILGLAVCIPLAYRYRMAEYVLIDKPAFGALMALRESRKLMQRNRMNLFKLDLSLWVYYGGLVLSSFVSYGDVLLELVGISLPAAPVVSFFGFYLLYLLCQLGLYYLLRCQVDVTYALAYDSLLPKETEQNGVVLGNIFQM